jgi:hypothetical protein
VRSARDRARSRLYADIGIAAGSDLALRPRVEGVIHGQFEFELALVIEAEKRKAVGDRQEAGGLWCRVVVLGHIGPMDDAGHQGEGRVATEPVVLDKCLERALAVAVGVSGTLGRKGPRVGREPCFETSGSRGGSAASTLDRPNPDAARPSAAPRKRFAAASSSPREGAAMLG